MSINSFLAFLFLLAPWVATPQVLPPVIDSITTTLNSIQFACLTVASHCVYSLQIFDTGKSIVENQVSKSKTQIIIPNLLDSTKYKLTVHAAFGFFNQTPSSAPTVNTAYTPPPFVMHPQCELKTNVYTCGWELPVASQTENKYFVIKRQILIKEYENPTPIVYNQFVNVSCTHLQLPTSLFKPNTQYIITIQHHTSVSISFEQSFSLHTSTFSDTITTATTASEAETLTSIVVTLVILFVVVIPVCLLCCCILVATIIIGCIITAIVKRVLKNKRKQKSIRQQRLEQEKEALDHSPATIQEVLKQNLAQNYILDYEKLVFSTNEMLGSGAQGTVYKGTYYMMDVAVKLFLTTQFGLQLDLSEFYNESKLLSEHSNHPNVIRFIGVAHDPNSNQIALVTEFCRMGNLAQFVEKNDLSMIQKCQIALGIASGMAHLHAANLIHRDLKCENILLDTNLIPKIIDFGFSKQIQQLNASMNMTMNVGTAAYCAPEVVLKKTVEIDISVDGQSTTSSKRVKQEYDSKCDVYSYAIVLWVLFYRIKQPYGRDLTDFEILHELALNSEGYRPVILQGDAQQYKWYFDLMKSCWSVNPEERPTFEMICYQLQQQLQNGTV